jgi:hypothetical protein
LAGRDLAVRGERNFRCELFSHVNNRCRTFVKKLVGKVEKDLGWRYEPQNPVAYRDMIPRKLIRNPIVTTAAAVLLIFALLIVGWIVTTRFRNERARKTWKDETLQMLAGMSFTNEQIQTELDQIKNPTPTLDFGWAHDHVISMTNGDCLIYAFRHGFNNGSLDHLFLSRGTDAKWYYSTYHFCNHMAGLLADEPAGSIREFAERYALQEFDGKSDECLKHTWP